MTTTTTYWSTLMLMQWRRGTQHLHHRSDCSGLSMIGARLRCSCHCRKHASSKWDIGLRLMSRAMPAYSLKAYRRQMVA
ncbi:hypothetical protein JG687_00015726 [Phytophthora cactorum]|uniref:Uncharacterized protein n=1 Tax=Phytophthora cactorum TaxID=29920 RepID=A0A8T1TW52_9STRA|nr:hypothetical protein JG687_00015726 [Phytophthora cactorum]